VKIEAIRIGHASVRMGPTMRTAIQQNLVLYHRLSEATSQVVQGHPDDNRHTRFR
jgi:hypothetical protein